MNYDVSLEQYILSCAVLYKECVQEIELLSTEDFTDPIHKTIFEGIRELFNQNKNIDTMLLLQHLNKENVNTNDLLFITEISPLKINWREYISKLKDLTLKRKLCNLAERVLTSRDSGQALSERLEKEVFRLRENIQTQDFTPINETLLEAFQEIENRYYSEDLTGLQTGFSGLDKITDGLQRSDYIILAARPSMGKTAFALNILQNVAKEGKKIAFFSLEMSKRLISKRMLLSEALVSEQSIRNKKIDGYGWQKINNASGTLYKTNIYICDNAVLTVGQMKSMCRKVKRKKGLDLVVIDYLQLIKSKEGGSRREQVEAVSRDLKAMAKELDIPVLVISSLSRATESRKNKRPILSDLRETGQIEFDADVIMFLHREYYYNPEANPNLAELLIAKQRNGALGVIQLGWIGECTTFMDYGKVVNL
jgi:replicative DNA helicase